MAINEADHEKYLSEPSNIIPKSFISLEKFYDLQDKFRQTTNCNTQSSTPALSILEFKFPMMKEEFLLNYAGNLETCFPGRIMNSGLSTPVSSTITAQ